MIGVVLSGTRDDGTAGLATIKASGGLTIVQDPDDALYPGMPASALAHVAVDVVVPASRVAPTIAAMVRGESPPDAAADPPPEDPAPGGDEVTLICPECGGVLTEVSELGMTQWRCRIGHRFSPGSLVDTQAEGVESALWAAVRALEEREALLTRIADQASGRGQAAMAQAFATRTTVAHEHANRARGALAHATAATLRSLDDDAGRPHEVDGA